MNLKHISKAVDFIEKRSADLIELYFEQANVFSAIVGMFGIRALDSISPYKRHKHPDVAQQRFPDLCLGGKANPASKDCLESKGSTRAWAIQSHYDHPGWYVVWRYLVDPSMSIKPKLPVIIWRVDVVFLEKNDWKYETSKASAKGGGRTHTFGVIKPATKLRNAAAYTLPGIVIKGGKPSLDA